MVRVVLYAIMNQQKLIQTWVSSQLSLKGYCERIFQCFSKSSSVLIRIQHFEGYWIYYFKQDGFFFLLAAEGQERTTRMQNYLRVVADIFYQSYDQNKFPTVLDRLMKQINKIEELEVGQQQHEGLMGRTVNSQKKIFNSILKSKEDQSRFAYWITVILFLCIISLGIYYLLRKSNK